MSTNYGIDRLVIEYLEELNKLVTTHVYTPTNQITKKVNIENQCGYLESVR